MVCPDKKINFTSTSDGIALQYSWDFKDGANASIENPSHIYTVQGTYFPQLFVMDANNCRDFHTKTPRLNRILLPLPNPQ